jgi:Recombination endonuclease VII
MNIRVCCTCKLPKDIKEDYYSVSMRRCKECERKRKKEERKRRSHHITDRRKWLKKNYNITQEIYDEMYKNQNEVCAICNEKEINSYIKGRLSIDHCHSTMKIRGLLCRNCNLALGHFKDSPVLLLKAIEYLNENYSKFNHGKHTDISTNNFKI